MFILNEDSHPPVAEPRYNNFSVGQDRGTDREPFPFRLLHCESGRLYVSTW